MTDTLRAKGPWWEMAPYLRAREAFKTHGAMRAEESAPVYTGHLPAEYSDSARSADYVVYSYDTPIAWHVPGEGWTIPDHKYSVTTSAHQGKVRTCIPEYAER